MKSTGARSSRESQEMWRTFYHLRLMALLREMVRTKRGDEGCDPVRWSVDYRTLTETV